MTDARRRHATARDGIGIGGIIRIRAWDVRDLGVARSDWDVLTRDTRHRLLFTDAVDVDPVHDAVAENLVTDDYLSGLAAGHNPEPSHLAIGDDDSTAADGTDDALNNEVYRATVGSDEQDFKDRLTSTFVSQNEANGLAIREVGFASGPRDGAWELLTHVILASGDQIDEKTSNMTVTIDYLLYFERAT